MFNKQTLCVEESVHVLFDETNSLVEDDAQETGFELGLTRKDLLPGHEKGKSTEDGSGSGAVPLEDGQGLNQIGGSTAEPGLDQNQPNSSRTSLETSARIGSGTVPEPTSPSVPTRIESVSVDPLTP